MRHAFTAIVPIVIIFLALGAIAAGVPQSAAGDCAGLLHNTLLEKLPNTTLTSAEVVSAPFTPPGAAGRGGRGPQAIEGLPSFCRVTATFKPSPMSDVKVEVWLPATGWNQKLEAVGNGGLAGTISYPALATAIKDGYASASTDTGHVATDNTWLADEEKEKDYGYRAIHGMTLIAKAVLEQFYGNLPKRSYFNGCSTGGGQAFGEAQLYPNDYDGMIAGAPQDFPTNLRAAGIWEFQVANNDAASKLPRESLAVVTAAVLKKCGGEVNEGFLYDPQSCSFDPAEVVCKAGQDPTTCISQAQATAIKKIYQGAQFSGTKKQIWPGLVPGSEAPMGIGWEAAAFTGNGPFAPSGQFYMYGVYQDPALDFHTMDIDKAVKMAQDKYPFINHTSTNLAPFMQHGGKLLMYHGWADPAVSPLNTVDYYGSLVEAAQSKGHLDQAAALKETQKSARLFMVPGMGHCGGGPGPTNFDTMTALDQWVDKGTAPEKLIASHLMGGVPTFTRPLCPYPQEPEYSGSGDRANASSWVCKARPIVFDAAYYKGLQ